MDDAARLGPDTGAALHAATLTKDREAALKRDMVIYPLSTMFQTPN